MKIHKKKKVQYRKGKSKILNYVKKKIRYNIDP